ncbi:MAG: hypothetical protein K0B08_07940, partial [Bacteroidales bacterium]|nr:hypothetical protein [Bacteroidales bacterium]
MKKNYTIHFLSPGQRRLKIRALRPIAPAVLMLAFLLSSFMGWGQPLLVENFDYTNGTALTANGWTAHSAGGTNAILVTNPSTISYPGYLSSGIGGEVTLATSGEDVNRTFTAQESGTVYFSLMVNVTTAAIAGDYIFHISTSPLSTSYFRGRFWVKRDESNNIYFGISQSTTTVNYTTAAYSLSTTYLIALKYEMVSGTTNDLASIYVNPPLNAPIPTSGWITNIDASGTDPSNIGSVALRQGNASNAPSVIIDGIRTSTDWADIVGAPTSPTLMVAPSSLSGFTYMLGGGPSASQSYDLSGVNLTGFPGNITVTGSTNYEVSLDDGTFSGSVNVPFTSATLNATPIYVRLKAGLAAGNYDGELISNAGGGASTVNVTCNGYVISSSVTYTWTGAIDDDWQVAGNWSPARTAPLMNDILQFNDGGTYTITNVPAQTIGQLTVSAGTKVTLQAAAPATLTIGGDTGDDLAVTGSGSELNISGTSALSLSLSSGATGLIGGSMTFTSAAHKLLGADASAITFSNGATFTSGTGLSGNPFGNTTSGSVIFESGSEFVYFSGSNPFAISNAVVVFQTGSKYIHKSTNNPSFSGRTYADFELDIEGAITVTGASAVSIDNLTLTNGTMNFNMTATPGHSIKNNITLANGTILNFGPTAVGTVNLNGSTAQTISGSGIITSSTANSTINIDNASGVSLNNSATLNNLTVSTGDFTVVSDASLIINGTATSTVTVERYIAGWTNDMTGWHLLSSPVAAQAVDPAFTDPTPGNYDFYAWDEVSDLWLNQKEPGNGITTFTPGKGYLVAYQTTGTKQFLGALNNADVVAGSLTLTPGNDYSGWNLLGNPFPSALNWNDGVDWIVPADIAGTAKIWNESTASYVDIAPDGIIPSMNGFMVQVLSGSPASLTIPVAARVHDATPWYKSGAEKIRLIASENTYGTAQESIIAMNDLATEGYDGAFDSRFLPGYAPLLYSTAGDEMLSTNTLPDLNTSRVIEMGF